MGTAEGKVLRRGRAERTAPEGLTSVGSASATVGIQERLRLHGSSGCLSRVWKSGQEMPGSLRGKGTRQEEQPVRMRRGMRASAAAEHPGLFGAAGL